MPDPKEEVSFSALLSGGGSPADDDEIDGRRGVDVSTTTGANEADRLRAVVVGAGGAGGAAAFFAGEVLVEDALPLSGDDAGLVPFGAGFGWLRCEPVGSAGTTGSAMGPVVSHGRTAPNQSNSPPTSPSAFFGPNFSGPSKFNYEF